MSFGNPSERTVVTLTCVSLAGSYWWIFGDFFPTQSGRLGHDYSYFFPALLNGYYWFQENGLFSVPWFTPALCGGVPLYPNPESLYYSLPQLLTFVTDPLNAVRASFAIFAAIGWAGSYALLRRSFGLEAAASALGAAIFLFNGYYAYRMIIGHLGFHSVMLVPLIAHLLLRPLPRALADRVWRLGLDSLLAGLCVAYMIQSGNHDLLPTVLATVGIGLIRALCGGSLRSFLIRFVAAFGSALLFSASKLASGFALLNAFPRSGYPLPGAESLVGVVRLILQSLFLWPAHEPAQSILVNSAWTLERHEFEYGVSFVPALILAAFAISKLWGWIREHRLPALPRGARALQWVALLALLALPIAVNYHTPAWNALLKQVPVLKHSSNFIRWFGVYVPIVCALAALALNRTGTPRFRAAAAAIAILTVVAVNTLAGKAHYAEQPYDPRPVVEAHQLAAETGAPPPILQLRSVDGLNRNDLLTRGISPIGCYEAIFGYRLEWFPKRELRPGRTLAAASGRLNLLNPACFAFPEANHCRPGDRFSAAERENAELFVRYRPFPFERPASQQLADLANLSGLSGLVAFLLLYCARAARRAFAARAQP